MTPGTSYKLSRSSLCPFVIDLCHLAHCPQGSSVLQCVPGVLSSSGLMMMHRDHVLFVRPLMDTGGFHLLAIIILFHNYIMYMLLMQRGLVYLVFFCV